MPLYLNVILTYAINGRLEHFRVAPRRTAPGTRWIESCETLRVGTNLIVKRQIPAAFGNHSVW